MYYIFGYLTVGVLVLIFAVLQKRRQNGFVEGFTNAIMEDLHPERKRWRYRLLHEIIIPSLAGLLMIISWPYAIYVHVKYQQNEAIVEDEEEIPEPPVFAVEMKDLLEKTSRQEIEAKEIIFDPLGAVPNLPFGHLNASWQQFIANMESGDTLWTFSALWKAEWGRPETRQGYAIVRDATIPHHYVTKYS